MNGQNLRLSVVTLLAFILVACQATSTPTYAPTSEPSATSTLVNTATPKPTSTATSIPTSTATPLPPSRIDTGMGGDLSIQGVVRDSSGKVVPNVSVDLAVYGAKGGWDIGLFGNWGLYTDETGSYSFDKVVRLENGHYEIWFNGKHEYGKAYENSGYWIGAREVKGNLYSLNVIMHAVTNSVFSGVIQYEDADGSIRNFYSPPFTQPEPGYMVELFRAYRCNVSALLSKYLLEK